MMLPSSQSWEGKEVSRKILFTHPYILIVRESLKSTIEFNNTSLKKNEGFLPSLPPEHGGMEELRIYNSHTSNHQ